METVYVRIVNKSDYDLPNYARLGDSGMDIRANIKEPIQLDSLDRVLVSTGIYLDIPEGYEVQVRSRSGLTLKNAIVVANGVGTIDSSYKGEIGVILINLSKEVQTIEPGQRIAQLVLAKVEKAELIIVPEITNKTDRGDNGYGSSGKF